MGNGRIERDAPRERCGVFGIFGHPRAASLTYYGLLALQHRGQEASGMAVAADGSLRVHKRPGLVTDGFSDETLTRLEGTAAIGHTLHLGRDASRGANDLQPLFVRHREGELAFCYNGALTNADVLRQQLEDEGSIFHTQVDIEVTAHLMARRHAESLSEALRFALGRVQGGFAGVWLSPGTLLAARDAHGIRPLCLGKIEWPKTADPVLSSTRETAWVVASETCALDTIGAEFVREIAPGELLLIDGAGLRSTTFAPPRPQRLCSFEFVYFARPDSNLSGRNVHIARKNLGRQLAKEHPAAADVVIGVPDSSLAAASGYAEQSGLPYEVGLIKNRYIGRTFIKPTRRARERSVLVNLNAVRQVVAGKRVVLVDDSIVRGTTARRMYELLREAGAAEVHMRISAPPFRYSCPYGLTSADESELMATGRTEAEMEAYVGADSLRFLSLEGLFAALGGAGSLADQLQGTYPRREVGGGRDAMDVPVAPTENGAFAGEFCAACFSGYYPVPLAAPGDVLHTSAGETERSGAVGARREGSAR